MSKKKSTLAATSNTETTRDEALATPEETKPQAMWWLYLIECEDGSYYAGISTDVERRYAEHLAGKGASYTRSHKPVRLIGKRECGSRSAALKAELAIKKLRKAQKISALLGD